MPAHTHSDDKSCQELFANTCGCKIVSILAPTNLSDHLPPAIPRSMFLGTWLHDIFECASRTKEWPRCLNFDASAIRKSGLTLDANLRFFVDLPSPSISPVVVSASRFSCPSCPSSDPAAASGSSSCSGLSCHAALPGFSLWASARLSFRASAALYKPWATSFPVAWRRHK